MTTTDPKRPVLHAHHALLACMVVWLLFLPITFVAASEAWYAGAIAFLLFGAIWLVVLAVMSVIFVLLRRDERRRAAAMKLEAAA